MLDETSLYRKPFLLAISLHILLLGFLLSHLKMPAPNPVVQSSNNIIKAVAINQQPSLQTQIQSIQQVEQQKMVQEKGELQHEQKFTEQKTAPLPAQRVAEQKVAEQQQRAAEEKAMQQQAALEAAEAKAEQQKLQQAKAKQAKKKLEQEQKRLAQQAIEQELAQQEKQEKQTAARQKQKQLKAAKLAAQQLLQQQLAATDDATPQQTNTLNVAEQGQIDKYAALVKNAIGQQWIIPDDSKKDLQGKMLVKVAPGGMVLNVQITKSSGDAAFDRAARAAVFKASPLPVPKDKSLFEQFRLLNLTFKPEGIST